MEGSSLLPPAARMDMFDFPHYQDRLSPPSRCALEVKQALMWDHTTQSEKGWMDGWIGRFLVFGRWCGGKEGLAGRREGGKNGV